MKILFFGDVFGRPGREALAKIIPLWRKKYSPDVVIANAENISHGAGISAESIAALRTAGVTLMTGGNHSLEGKDAATLLDNPEISILRPQNFYPDTPGRGFGYFDVEGKTLLLINLIGQVHMREPYDSPWRAIDEVLAENDRGKKAHHIIVDWHADITSEKRAMGWYLDGKVSAVFGTHTHTPSADEQILPNGTAFISDVGMSGAHYSIIGQEISANLSRFLTHAKPKVDVAPAPPYESNAVFLEIDDATGKAVRIVRIRKVFDGKSAE